MGRSEFSKIKLNGKKLNKRRKREHGISLPLTLAMVIFIAAMTSATISAFERLRDLYLSHTSIKEIMVKGNRRISSQDILDAARLRVGIGRPPGRMDAVDYVLKKFKSKDEILLDQVLDTCADAVETFLNEGIEKAMTRFNQSILDNEK